MQLLTSEVSAAYYTRPPGIVSLSMLTITYTHAITSNTYTESRFNNYTVNTLDSLYNYHTHGTSVMSVMKIGNIMPRAGIEPTSVALMLTIILILFFVW